METPQKNLDAAAAVRRAKIRRRKIISAGAVFLLVLATAALIVRRTDNSSDLLDNLETARVQRTTIDQVISATGSVTAQTGAQVRIGSQITGRIKRLFADVGSHVKAGQVIAELDLPDTKAQLEQAEANLKVAQVKLTEQESGVGLQQTNAATEIAKAKAGVDSAQAAYQQAIDNAKLQVNAAEAAVRQAQATANNAKTFLSRNQKLLDKGYIAAQDVDNARTQSDVANAQLDSARQNLVLTRTKTATDVRTAQNAVDNAKAVLRAATAGKAQNVIKAQQVAEARAAVEQAKAQVDYWRAQYDKTIIRSPISGTVLALDVQQGETIAAGLAAPTLIRVTDLNRLQVDAMVDETDIGSVRIGQPAKITVDAYPNRSFRGRVVKIASGATMQQNVVTYDTTIAVDNPKGLLKPDMTATAQITVGAHPNVLAVPIEAVKPGPKGQVVYIVDHDKVISQPVVTGVSNDTVTEIVKGVRDGQTVVLAGYEPGGEGRPRMTPFGPMGGRRQNRSGGGGRAGGARQ